MAATPKAKIRRPLTKRADIESALSAHDRIQAVSDEIRRRVQLEPVPENSIVQGWREKLAAFADKPVRRSAKPSKPLTQAEQIDDLGERMKRLKAERSRLDRDVCEAVQAGASVSRVAEALGVSRQRVYQLAGS